MIKEEMFKDYQSKYENYYEKHKEVDELKDKAGSLRKEKEREKKRIENEKKNTLDIIRDRKDELKKQLRSVNKDGVKSATYRKFNEKKLTLISEKEEKIDDLNNKKSLAKKRLDDLENGGDGKGFIEEFNEKGFRLKLSRKKESEMDKLSEECDSSIEKAKNKLDKVDGEFASKHEKEISAVESDTPIMEVYSNINNKRINGQLPKEISTALEEQVDVLAQRNNISDAASLIKVAGDAEPLGDLLNFIPGWLRTIVFVLLPILSGGVLFLSFIISGARAGFVETASNAVVTFLLWVLCGAVGALIIGVITYIKFENAIVGAIIGGVLGFWIGTQWSVDLPSSVINVVDWIAKIVLCVGVGIGVGLLNSLTPIGELLLKVGLLIGPVKKASLSGQGKAVYGRIDSYSVLIRYKDVIDYVVDSAKEAKKRQLLDEIEKLKDDKTSSLKKLSEELDRKNENLIRDEKRKIEARNREYEKQQLSLAQRKEECEKQLYEYENEIETTTNDLKKIKGELEDDKNELIKMLERDISGYDDKLKKEENRYNQEIEASGNEYSRRIERVEKKATELDSEFEGDLKELHEIFISLGRELVDESNGVLSDYIYIYKEIPNKDDSFQAGQIPRKMYTIEHRKRPIVFLYDIDDSKDVSVLLLEFIKAVLGGFISINDVDLLSISITDPVSQARAFKKDLGGFELVSDMKDISSSITDSMNMVSEYGEIDDYNKEMKSKGKECFKYNIGLFLIPRESDAKSSDVFDSDLWGSIQDGYRFGFVPIFFINYNDWKDTLDDEKKANVKFIKQLKKSIGSDNGKVYRIDPENVSIEEIKEG